MMRHLIRGGIFDNLVNEKQMVQFLKKQNPTGLRYTFTSSAEDGNLQALMVHNGESSSYQVKSGSGEITETVQENQSAIGHYKENGGRG